MRLAAIVFVAFVAIFAATAAYPLAQLGSRLRTAYLESAEDQLVDTANILAAFVGRESERGDLNPDELYKVFEDVRGRDVAAQIYDTTKSGVDLSVYVTDDKGVVIFDADDRGAIGQDFSQWRDVKRTLDGQYGARIRRNPDDPDAPAALFVAAPIRVSGRIAGVLTVIKPTTNIMRLVETTVPRIFRAGAVSLALAAVLGVGVSLWVHQQVSRLTRYANDVREGRRVPFPDLAPTELKTMGVAFEKMREALAGQAYVEKYVEALTHEIKSPISGIRGAAEILEDPSVSPAQRDRFLANIQHETRRIQELVDRMLMLTELEARQALTAPTPVALGAVARTVAEESGPALLKKQLHVEVDVPDGLTVSGDSLLLHLAISNLVQNAIDFSPPGARVRVTGSKADGTIALCVDDEGPGVPEFARARVFEKFFSLERPDNAKKSTGLGLNFVSEIAALHGGSVDLTNLPDRGLRARIALPAA